ncbi:MAG: lipoate--protein ligase family protein [Candidatus Omnitrophica bacterium]|nr:lipoate--protein ligase family protein [Candidatus Omnitrophota bacterium]
MKTALRLIRTQPLDGYQNMALDEALFLSSISSGKPVVTARLYEWAPPAFSFGVSQKISEIFDIERCRRQKIGCVRRMTGGGIIFHDNEITYSLIVPELVPMARRPVPESFKALCSFLIIFYSKLGLRARFAIDEPYGGAFGEHTAFCFAGREKYDILISGKKIGGNAQKRLRGHIFQHGSIPVAALKEHMHAVPPKERLFEALYGSLKEAFGATAEIQEPTKEEWKFAERLKYEKYQTEAWNIEHKDPRGSIKRYRLETVQK